MVWVHILALVLLSSGHVVNASTNYAEAITKNVGRIKSSDDIKSTALTYGSGGDNPLAIPQEDFAQMYQAGAFSLCLQAGH